MLPKCSIGALSFFAAIAVCFALVAGPAFAQEEVEKPTEEKADAEKELTPELLGRLDEQESENPLFKLVDEVTAGMKQIEDLLNQQNTVTKETIKLSYGLSYYKNRQ